MSSNIHIGNIHRDDRLLAATEYPPKIYRPSLRAQHLNNSKVNQVKALSKFMIPSTFVCRTKQDLMDALNELRAQKVSAIVSKEDTGGCGLGIHKWDGPDFDMCYNVLSMEQNRPCVIQPYLEGYLDFRIITAYHYIIDVYQRVNPNNFRQNLRGGGVATSYTLAKGISPSRFNVNNRTYSGSIHYFLKQIMEVGQFHFAHVDLLFSPTSNAVYLSEISLNGGTKGSIYTTSEILQMKQQYYSNPTTKLPWEY